VTVGGPALNQLDNSRGAACGDFDNDGDLDVLINNQDGPPTLLRNDGGNRNHWLMLRCLGRRSNRLAIGTRLIARAGSSQQIREIKAGSSYGSQNDLRVHFGLGAADTIDTLEIRWPSGKVDRHEKVMTDQLLTIEEPAKERGPNTASSP